MATRSPSPPDQAPPASARTPLARLARLTYRRRGRTLLAWVALLAAVLALAPALAGEFEADYSTPGSQSAAAAALIAERFPERSGDTVTVVWQDADGVRTPAVQRAIGDFLARAGRLEGVGRAEPARIARDGTIAVTQIELDRRSWDVPVETGRELIALAAAAERDGLRIELGGRPVQEAQGGGSPEGLGLLLAAVILLIAFGSVIAAGLPILVALFGLGISSTLIGVLAAILDVPEFAPAVAGLIGIGVGIDYALLILTRFRTALAGGRSPLEATVEAVTTAGRSVLVAGGTVVISLLGLFLMGVAYLQGVALSASLSVLVVMAAAVTLLPALLGFAGARVNRLRIPGLGRTLARPESTTELTLAGRWARTVQRAPAVALVAGLAVTILLTAPVLGLRLGFPDAANDTEGSTTRAAYELVRDGFGAGANGPLLLAADVPRGADAGAMDALAARLRRDPGVAFVAPPQPNADGDAALIAVTPRTAPQDPETEELVTRLRDEVVPAATAGTGVAVSVGGLSAAFIDQSELVAERLPLFVAGVVGLSFLLLLGAFRAPVVALKAALMNLLSIAAAYGVIALFAGGGVLGELIGLSGEVPIAPFIPVMMFAILFGLSMDYEVFLLSRVREEHLGGKDTTTAVRDGLAKTARVITAAAAVMVAVFLAFVTAPESFLKLLGIGMATAILVDATIVRMVLVPAVMQLLGRANWWLPGWLDRALPAVERPAGGGDRAAARARA